jgi:predicted dehydrogenase
MFPETKLQVGVVGVGALGRHHSRLYNLSDKCDVVGIYDANPENANAVGEEYGLKIFDSMEELAKKCDALSVAVPATYHHKVAMPLLKMNKHLLIEKPIASQASEGKEIVEEAENRNLCLAVGHVERFNPGMDFLARRSAATRFIEAHRLAKYPPARPGLHRRGTEVSVVLDLMIHDLDLILTMVDSEVERFDAVGIPVLSKTEDIASVRIKFKNGSVANLTASRISVDPQRRFRVFQEDCYISLDYGESTGMILRKNRVGISRKDINFDEKNALEHELEDFMEATMHTIESGVIMRPKVSGIDGLKALELAEEISNNIVRYNDDYGFKFG